MKLFAIVDKDGKPVEVNARCDDDTDVSLFWSGFRIRREIAGGSVDGYRCIELHTYDPSKQEVIDLEPNHNRIVKLTDMLMAEAKRQGCKCEVKFKFLKAGEQKL